MAKQELKFQIRSVAPLLMHNGRLADPMDPITKALKKISGKRQKTDADQIEIARLEWYGGLHTKDGKPCIPGEAVESALIEAAKKIKLGTLAKQSIFCPDDCILDFPDTGKTIDELWECGKYRFTCRAKVRGSAVMRTRPRFDEWATTICIVFEDTIIDPEQIRQIVVICGDRIGLLDWRPRFGRFVATEMA